MQWDGEVNGGFTSGTPWLAVNENCREINVKDSLADPDSIFAYYQKLVEMRKQYDVISDGSYEPVFVDNQGIMSYKRVLNGEKLLVFANFTRQEQLVKQNEVLDDWEVLLSNYESVKIFGNKVALKPFGAVILYVSR
ncbi:alpha-amylase family glycosyl hydrolase, partial [Weissella cibaria]